MSEKTEEPITSNNSFSYADSVLAAVGKNTVHITFTTVMDGTHHVGTRISIPRKRAIYMFQSLVDDFKKLDEEE